MPRHRQRFATCNEDRIALWMRAVFICSPSGSPKWHGMQRGEVTGRYQPIERIDLVRLGDVLVSLHQLDGLKVRSRPWTDPWSRATSQTRR